MVRPVEPEPPDALRKVSAKVRRTEAAPDKLAYPEVERRQQGQREDHQTAQDEGLPLDADAVEIHRDDGEQQTRERKDSAPPLPEKRTPHIDVAG